MDVYMSSGDHIKRRHISKYLKRRSSILINGHDNSVSSINYL